MSVDADRLRSLVRDVPDFPEPGIVFKDLTPMLASATGLLEATEGLAGLFEHAGADAVVAIDARGFLFGAPVAQHLGVGLVPVRKPGKLPWETHLEEYALEYGTDGLEIHRDGLAAGAKALVIDDVLATGGTAAAAVRLVERSGATVAGIGLVIELGFLDGRARLPGHDVRALLTY